MDSPVLKKKVQRHNRRAARNAIAHAVLVGLMITAGAALITAPGLAHVFKLLPRNRRTPSALARTFQQLYAKGLISLTGTRGARMAQLTDHGMREAYLHSIALPTITKQGWDRTWYMVSFDIPTGMSRARDALRLKLKELGFKEYQKSIYLYPHGCESEIDFVVTYFGVGAYTKRFYAADLSDNARVQRAFGLS